MSAHKSLRMNESPEEKTVRYMTVNGSLRRGHKKVKAGRDALRGMCAAMILGGLIWALAALAYFQIKAAFYQPSPTMVTSKWGDKEPLENR